MTSHLHCEDRPSFFIPGITGKARCLSSSSESNSTKTHAHAHAHADSNTTSNLSVRDIAIGLASFRESQLRRSSRSAPDRMIANATANATANANANAPTAVDSSTSLNMDVDSTMDMARFLHQRIMGTIKDSQIRETRSRSNSEQLSLSKSLISVHAEPALQAETTTTTNRRKSTRKSNKNDSFQRTTPANTPTTTKSTIKIRDMKTPKCSPSKTKKVSSPTGVVGTVEPLSFLHPEIIFYSPSQKPRSTFLPPHLLLTPHANIPLFFQPFDADDVLPPFSGLETVLPPPPPLLGGRKGSHARIIMDPTTKKKSNSKTDDNEINAKQKKKSTKKSLMDPHART